MGTDNRIDNHLQDEIKSQNHEPLRNINLVGHRDNNRPVWLKNMHVSDSFKVQISSFYMYVSLIQYHWQPHHWFSIKWNVFLMDPFLGSPSLALLQKKISFKNDQKIPSSRCVAKLILLITELGFLLKRITFTHAFNKNWAEGFSLNVNKKSR